MEQLLCHLVGDYVLQNHWMARRKAASTLPCLIHVLLYGLPFLLLHPSLAAMAVIVGTHFIIDRWALAKYWVDFWGVGNRGWFWMRLSRVVEQNGDRYHPPRGRDDAPPHITFWLGVIVDNTMHLVVNYLALACL